MRRPLARATTTLLAATLLAALTAACATPAPSGATVSGPRTTVTAADFAEPSITRTPAPRHTPPADASQALANVRHSPAVAGAPKARPLPNPDPDETKLFVVDQMVGQVNGVPIYADAFYQDMDARLAAEAKRLSVKDWVKLVREDTTRKLWDETRDELLLSEFQSSLTAEQKVGVLAFIEDLRKDIQRSYGGSSEVANERLQESEGVTLTQKVESEAERQFIIAQLRQSIASRVQVSFKDIQLYYQQNIERFRPPPVAILKVIRIPLSRDARIDEATTRLDAGEDPAAIAAELSNWATDDDNAHTVVIETRNYQETTFWGPEPLNDATRALTVGQTTPRIDFANHAWWVTLVEIEEPPGKSLYEAQLEIEAAIRNQRIGLAEQRYFRSLLDRSNVTDLETMVDRLVAYAAEKHLVRRLLIDQQTPAQPAPDQPAG